VAAGLLAKTDTYLLWEKDRATPTVRFYPAIFRFLGYDPFPAAVRFADRVRAKRRRLGLTIEAAAKLAGVDEATFSRWEGGKTTLTASKLAAQTFLALDL